MWRSGLLAFVAVILAGCNREELTIRVSADPEATVVIGIFDPQGAIVRQYEGKGATAIQWDGKDENGTRVSPGDYRWSAFTHRGFGAKASGVACLPAATGAMPPSEEPPRWGGRGGAPSAVAADGEHVYLGWSGGQVVACDLEGGIEWSVALPDGAECRALAVDGDVVVALARGESGDSLVKLRTRDGAPDPWTSGLSLAIVALWPADAETKPAQADAMTARSGRIFLTFTDLQFFAVLRRDTGEYLQTVVGPPASGIAVTPTKTESPGEEGKIVDADFAIVALRSGALGKVLFAHEPLWVMMSDFQALDRDERISAITLIGDGAKHHAHSVFVALDAPFFQVQRRSVLESEGFLWIAGRAGGRSTAGPWEAEVFGRVNDLALDARGRLWLAEGDVVPPRFSVWSTDGNQGRLEREFFGPVSPDDAGAAVLPGDTTVIVGAGCEWRIDPVGGPARCLGVITREGMAAASFRAAESGALLLEIRHRDGTTGVYERRGEGDYVPRGTGTADGATLSAPVRFAAPDGDVDVTRDGVARRWRIRSAEGLDLGFAGLDASPAGKPAQAGNFVALAAGGIWRIEITGIEGMRRQDGGRLRFRAQK